MTRSDPEVSRTLIALRGDTLLDLLFIGVTDDVEVELMRAALAGLGA